MRFENLKFEDERLPIILRRDTLWEKSSDMCLHWHEAVEVLWITHGRLRINSEKEQAEAEEGDLVCIHTGRLHLYEPLTKKCDYACIIFPSQALESKALYRSPLPRVTDDAEAVGWMEQLLTVLEEQSPFYRERGKGLLVQLYARLVAIGGEECPAEETCPTHLVKSVMEYLNDHYYQPHIRVEQVAAAVGVSRYHLSHVFKAVTGETVTSYIMALRCDLARRWLQNGATVAFTAERSGFSSQSYFCRAYQKYFGILPSKDRRK